MTILDELVRYLKLVEAAGEMMARPTELKYRSYESLVLHEGRAWTPVAMPPFISAGQMKHCYYNAIEAVRYSLQHPPDIHLRYCEGYAVTPLTGIPVPHAWAVTPDGRVLDRTWPDPETCAYYGMTFELEEVERLLEVTRGFYGVLASEYIIGHPLLETGRLILPEAEVAAAPLKPTLRRLALESLGQARLFQDALDAAEEHDPDRAYAALGFAFAQWTEIAGTLGEGCLQDPEGRWLEESALRALIREASLDG